MKARRLVGLLLAAVLLSACEGSVTVTNGSKFPVRASIAGPGSSGTYLLDAGQSLPFSGNGTWTVTVIADKDWVETVKKIRDQLAADLASGTAAFSERRQELNDRLKLLNALIKNPPGGAQGKAASCHAVVEENGETAFVVGVDEQGFIWCR